LAVKSVGANRDIEVVEPLAAPFEGSLYGDRLPIRA
jgi:hypothetical protein